MIPDTLKNRLRKERPMTSVTLRMPVDVVESMKVIAPQKGFSGYQALLKSYIGAGLRQDEATYLFDAAHRLAQALIKRGVDPQLVQAAEREAQSAA